MAVQNSVELENGPYSAPGAPPCSTIARSGGRVQGLALSPAPAIAPKHPSEQVRSSRPGQVENGMRAK